MLAHVLGSSGSSAPLRPSDQESPEQTRLFEDVPRARLGLTDLGVSYQLMFINEGKVGGQKVELGHIRHNVAVELGLDALALGVLYQYATKTNDLRPGEPEHGLMLTGRYDLILEDFARIEALGRVAVNEPSAEQPLYAADTDLQINAVFFSADGWPGFDGSWFPSAYLGFVVNKHGRLQAVGGLGAWWEGVGLYITGLYSFNGVRDPMNPAQRTEATFAELQNAALSVSASYDLELSEVAQARFEVRRNFGLRNSGNDWVGSVGLRYFFGESGE